MDYTSVDNNLENGKFANSHKNVYLSPQELWQTWKRNKQQGPNDSNSIFQDYFFLFDEKLSTI